ncbi:hypothetical protein J7J18_06690 [bacterium]|nr:hypothetical protein [bacterium]
MTDVITDWDDFERALIYQRYSIRHPKTSERLEKTYEDIIDRITNFILSRKYPVSNDLLSEALQMARNRKFTFATPVLMNLGNPYTRRGGFYSCFPLGPIPDSTKDILRYIEACASIFQYAGGVGLDFSSLRPEGSAVDQAQGVSSGPVGFVPMFEATSKSIAAGGKRRGAMLGQLDYNHPDIFKYVRLKRDRRDLWSINISVNAFGDFWEQRDLIKEIALGMWTSGDPGLLFPDVLAEHSPYPPKLKPLVRYVNPCAEYASPPFSVCHLLTGNALSAESVSDFEALGYYMTHIGNAILYLTLKHNMGLPKEPKWLYHKLRERVDQIHPVGIGLTGVAEYLFKKGYKYTDVDRISEMYTALARGSLIASNEWALSTKVEKEWDPTYKDEHLSLVGYTKRSRKFWNTTTLSQAPTGSVSQFLRCVSTGLEPLESFQVKRQFLNSENEFQTVILKSSVTPSNPTTLPFIPPEEQIKVVSTVQQISHTSASKTINVPKETTVEEIEEIIYTARKYRLKGLTVYRRGCALESIVEADEPERDVLIGQTYKFKGLNNIYITVNRSTSGKPIEVFVSTGKSGNVVNGLAMGLGRLVSLALRSGTRPEVIMKSLSGIETGDFYVNSRVGRVTSICDAVAKALSDTLQSSGKVEELFDLCPKCQNYTLTRNGQGCKSCSRCGYSTC